VNVLDLFSGIGGFSLGLERAGMKTVAFCEIEKYPRAILAKHWPGVPIYDDVRTLTASRLEADGISVDVICGGFPCQDISFAGAGAGLAGERSGLWREYARLIGEIRPRYVIVENVSALLSRGLGDVLGDLAEIGYDAEWHCIPASAIGAPHRRDRVWIVAYSLGIRCGTTIRKCAGNYAKDSIWRANRVGDAGAALADASCPRLQDGLSWRLQQTLAMSTSGGWWDVEPDVGRVADGIPRRVDRLKGLGNAIVPQIPELIGRAIMEMEVAG
jgi:DNA (cytosine-5)-methyltransferase 1